MKTFAEYLCEIQACGGARVWAGDRTVEQVVTDCHRGDWLLWLAKNIGVEKRLLVLTAGRCAATVKHLMTDQRSFDALDVCERYGVGLATDVELSDAVYAVTGSIDDAAYAADAAAYAANASGHAAASAACVASEDWVANQLQTANICRELIGAEIIRLTNEILNQ